MEVQIKLQSLEGSVCRAGGLEVIPNLETLQQDRKAREMSNVEFKYFTSNHLISFCI